MSSLLDDARTTRVGAWLAASKERREGVGILLVIVGLVLVVAGFSGLEAFGITVGVIGALGTVIAALDARSSSDSIAALAERIELGLGVEKRMRVADAAHRVLEHVWGRQDAIERGSTYVAHEKVERVMTQFGNALAVAKPVELPASLKLNAALVKYTILSLMGKGDVSAEFLAELRRIAQAAYYEANRPPSRGS